MPVLRIYPASVFAAQSFTVAQLNNVLGNTTTYAVHTGTIAVYGGYGGTFKFNFTDLPANIGSISKIEAGVIAKCNIANTRQMYSFECYNGSTILFKTQPSTTNDRLTTADSTLLMDTTTVAGGVFDNNVALWRNNNIEVNLTFTGIANPGGAYTTSWQKFWLDITYELKPSSGDILFSGTDF